MHALRLIQQEG